MPVIPAAYAIAAGGRADASMPKGNPQRAHAVHLVRRLWNGAPRQGSLRGGAHPPNLSERS